VSADPQPPQPTTFDRQAFLRAALAATELVAVQQETFTTDDVWELLNIGVDEPRVLGSVMLQARAQGLCSPTPAYTQSQRPECHARPIRVWQSDVFQGVQIAVT
jgi:hypothetical protein